VSRKHFFSRFGPGVREVALRGHSRNSKDSVLDSSSLYQQDCRTWVRNVLCESDSLISELETLNTAVVGTVRSLLSSDRHGKAPLYVFQKHLLLWGLEYIFYRSEVKSWCFLEPREIFWSCVRCASTLISLPL